MKVGIEEKLLRKMVASCECSTKTPEVQYHDEMCLYRILNEAVNTIIHLTVELQSKDDPHST